MNQIAFNIGSEYLGSGHFLTNIRGVGKLVGIAASNMISIAGVILVIMIIYSGTSMITAAGDSQAFERARNILTASVIGFVLVVAAWLLVRIVQTGTGVPILN